MSFFRNPFRKTGLTASRAARKGLAGRRAAALSSGNGRTGRSPSPERLRYFVGVLVFVGVWSLSVLAILRYRQLPTYHLNLVAGQVANVDVYSSIPFTYTDLKVTERDREIARQGIPSVFRIRSAATDEAIRLFDGLAARLVEPPGEQPLRSAAFEAAIKRAVDELERQAAAAPLVEPLNRPGARDSLRNLLLRRLRHGIVADNPEDTFFAGMKPTDTIVVIDEESRRVQRTVAAQLTRRQAAALVVGELPKEFGDLTAVQRQAVEALAVEALRPNLEFDAQITGVDREDAARKVAETKVLIEPDVLLVRRGEQVSEEMLLKLRAHAQEQERDIQQRHVYREALFFGGVSLCLLLVLVFALGVIAPETLARTSRMVLVGFLIALQFLITWGFTNLFAGQIPSNLLFMSAVPLAAGAMLMSQVLGLRSTLCVIVYTSVIEAAANPQPLHLFVISFVSCTVGAILFRRARKRLHSLQAAGGIAATVVFLQFLFIVKNQIPMAVIGEVAWRALANGFAATAIAFVTLPLLEVMFGITTDISLLELGDLNHPLLKRLQMEAPGTYHHSLMVATLSEQAAAAIGANPLLARVCAYFHDIGKLSQPEYFTENIAFGNRTPHDNLQPRLSSLVILNHVREGLALAERYKLRKVIREAIAEHHGSSLISFFYHRAKGRQEGAREDRQLNARDYRYPGPPPTRKEIVLISIADSCEAASRSLEKPTPQKIGNLVGEIISKKIIDGQLDHADLTFQELAIAKQAIIRALTNMFHGRIAYPKDDEREHPAEGANPPDEADTTAAAS